MFGGMIIVWVIIIGGIVQFVKYMADQNRSINDKKESQPGALEILQERYAQGEINREEFEERKQIFNL